jgi:signal transduction histidine kinase
MIEMLPERSKEYIGRLKRNAERLYTLSSDILDATKIETGNLRMKFSDFDLAEAINEVVKDMRKKSYAMYKKEDIDYMIPNIEFSEYGPFPVRADKNKIIQVVSNLLDNALKFGGHGGVTITMDKNDSVNQLTVSVIDSGKGINPEVYNELFQKFVTKSDKGTGLGLYIAKGIVEAHGGHISGTNNKNGVGATFSFSLPIHPP